MHSRLIFQLMICLTTNIAFFSINAHTKVFEDHVIITTSEAYTSLGDNVDIALFNEGDEPDIVISESHHGEDNHGKVHLILDISDLQSNEYDMAIFQANVTFIGNPEDRIGQSVEVCNVNGDGFDDIVFGRNELGGQEEVIFIFYGGSHWETGTVIEDVASEADLIIVPNTENHNAFGISKCFDVNNDGYDDILGGKYPVLVLGDVYPSGTVLDLDVDIPAVRFANQYDSSRFFGDVNGDGNPDFLFNSGGFTGWIYVWFGFDDYSTPRVLDFTLNPPDVEEEGPYLYAYYQIVDVGDWNGDGADDLLARQYWSDSPSIYRLNPGVVGMQPGHEYIYQFAVMSSPCLRLGDLNGDNQLDLLADDEEF